MSADKDWEQFKEQHKQSVELNDRRLRELREMSAELDVVLARQRQQDDLRWAKFESRQALPDSIPHDTMERLVKALAKLGIPDPRTT